MVEMRFFPLVGVVEFRDLSCFRLVGVFLDRHVEISVSTSLGFESHVGLRILKFRRFCWISGRCFDAFLDFRIDRWILGGSMVECGFFLRWVLMNLEICLVSVWSESFWTDVWRFPGVALVVWGSYLVVAFVSQVL